MEGTRTAPPALHLRHLERLVFLRPLHLTAADALDANTHALHDTVDLDLDALQVGPEGSTADAGDLATDPAQVFRLAAPRLLVPQRRHLPADRTVHAHDRLRVQPCKAFNITPQTQ